MRKGIAALIILILIFALTFLWIPGKMNIYEKIVVPVNPKAFAREISDEQKWKLWWPGRVKQIKQHPASFEINDNTYTIVEKKLSSLVISISKAKDSVLTELIFIPLQSDSVELTWHGIGKTSLNPISRIQKFLWNKNINSDLHFLLQKAKVFYSNEDNLYGFHIEKSQVPDSNLISTSAATTSYPETQLVYSLIEKLKNYVHNNGAKEMGYPMLNIYKNADRTYVVKVAIPTDKKLKDAGNIQYRWMLQGGNILVTEVKGGPHQIEKAFSEMETYVEDHHRIAPAIPFQSLLTDRRKEPDTNKWITKLYWPVM